jgi:hypothetical protein
MSLSALVGWITIPSVQFLIILFNTTIKLNKERIYLIFYLSPTLLLNVILIELPPTRNLDVEVLFL